MTPADRVRKLVASGSLGAAEGERLLRAMGTDARPAGVRLLLNPFDRFGGGVAALVGLVVVALSLAVTRLGVRFDGFIDLHVSRPDVPSFTVASTELAVAWLLPTTLFFACARILSRHADHLRFIDFAGFVGIARVPFLFAALTFVAVMRDNSSLARTSVVAVMATAGIGALLWMLVLLYRGFKHASGLDGTKLIAGFVGVAFAAEAGSKLVLSVALR